MKNEIVISECELPVDSNSIPVIFVEEFNFETSSMFKQRILELNSNPYFDHILINISSLGGLAYACLSMIDTMKSCSTGIIAVGSGYVASAGAILLACAPRGGRYMEPNAKMYLHSVQGGTRGSTEEIDNNTEIHKKLDKQIFDMMAKNSNISYKEIKETIKEKSGEWELTAKEALKYGFIDHIGAPSFSKRLTTTLTMG